jgi:hypothetical protein
MQRGGLVDGVKTLDTMFLVLTGVAGTDIISSATAGLLTFLGEV